MGVRTGIGSVVCVLAIGCQSGAMAEPSADATAATSGDTQTESTEDSTTRADTDSATSGRDESTGITSGVATSEGDDGSSGSSTGGDSGDGNEPPPCDFFSAPEGGSEGADGSIENPWGPLDQLAASQSVPEGTLCLLDGFHGNPVLQSFAPGSPTTIRAMTRGEATIGSLALVNVVDLSFWGITVDGTNAIDPSVDQRQMFLVTGDAATSNITLEAMRVQSAESSADWTQDGWVYEVRSGIDFRGPDISVYDSEIRNTYHALLLRGHRSTVEGNTIDNFGGDAIRGLGDDSRYSWNLVRDAYIDEYEVQHDDAFQAYRLEGEELRISNVTIDHNQFILFADPITDFVVEHELVGTLMQGVIITDGYADGWVVENNLVVNGQAHGISLFGARNCRVQNNTVVAHPQFAPAMGPWIRIADQTKTGQENFDNVIRNNVAQMLTPWDYDPTSLVEANSEGPWEGQLFLDTAALDFRPSPSSAAIDAGVDADLSEVDLDGNPRHVGASVDLGAYEAGA